MEITQMGDVLDYGNTLKWCRIKMKCVAGALGMPKSAEICAAGTQELHKWDVFCFFICIKFMLHQVPITMMG
jgi:hypothetical protein